MNLAKDILSKIKQDAITPRPAWHFWLKNTLFWLIFSVCVLAGAKAVAMITYALMETDFGLLLGFTRHPLWALGRLFPVGWIILFLCFIILAMSGLQHTKGGYKWGTGKLVAMNLVISLVLGLVTFATGIPEQFEHFVHKRVPYLPHNEASKEQVWSQPEEGRLAGTIVEIKNDEILLMNDFINRHWVILYVDSSTRGQVQIMPQEKIRLIGQQIDEQTFRADMITPWRKLKGMEMQRANKQMMQFQRIEK